MFASGSAFFYDTLKELGRDGSYKRLYGNVVSINNVGWGLSSLAGGFIAVYSLRINVWLVVATTAISLLVALTFTETKKYKHG